MLSDFIGADKVYIACGHTDLRKGIDGLAMMVQQQFQLDPFTNTLFLFCGRRRDRIKGLYWERDGFILHKFGENILFHYKVIEMHGFASCQPSYGIQAEVVEAGVYTYVTLIPAISFDRDFVDSLAQRCDRG